jgi:hypothetical protein
MSIHRGRAKLLKEQATAEAAQRRRQKSQAARAAQAPVPAAMPEDVEDAAVPPAADQHVRLVRLRRTEGPVAERSAVGSGMRSVGAELPPRSVGDAVASLLRDQPILMRGGTRFAPFRPRRRRCASESSSGP